MSTAVTFDIETDDEELRAVVAEVKDDPVLTWRIAVFCCQMQLDKAIKAAAVREHYDAIHRRARATRAARLANAKSAQPDEEQP